MDEFTTFADGKNVVQYCSEAFFDLYGVEPTSHDLTWRKSFRTIVTGIQSIGGIAKLAEVSRKTVNRRKIALGGMMAVEFVIGKWRGSTRPLVTHADPIHSLNFGQRLENSTGFPWTVLNVVALCQSYYERSSMAKKGIQLQPGQSLSHKKLGGKIIIRRSTRIESESYEKLSEKEKLWRLEKRNRNKTNTLCATIEPATNETINEFQKLERIGHAGIYKKRNGSVPVNKLCANLGVERQKFYQWRRALPDKEKKLLKAAMDGKLQNQSSAYDVPEASYEFTSAEDMDKRFGWKEPNED